jgi:hypothetical protein
VSPILESIGSVKGFGWGAFSLPSSFESIATLTGNGTFSSIPSTYKHLQLRVFALDTYAPGSAYNIEFTLTFNGDGSASNYAYHQITGNGATTSTNSIASGSYGNIHIPSGDAIAGYGAIGGAAIVDIVDYQSTTKNKTVRAFSGVDYNGNVAGFISLTSGLWLNNTTAINSVAIAFSGNGVTTGTKVALYGIKG